MKGSKVSYSFIPVVFPKLYLNVLRSFYGIRKYEVPESIITSLSPKKKNVAQTRRSEWKGLKRCRRDSLSPTPPERTHPHAPAAIVRRQLLLPTFPPTVSPSRSTIAIVRRVKEVGKLRIPRYHREEKAQEASEEVARRVKEHPRKNPLRLTGELAWSIAEANQANDIIDELVRDTIKETLREIIKRGGSNKVLQEAFDLKWNRPLGSKAAVNPKGRRDSAPISLPRNLAAAFYFATHVLHCPEVVKSVRRRRTPHAVTTP